MNIRQLHPWPTSQAEAEKIQAEFRHQVVIRPAPHNITLVAGADTAYYQSENRLIAAVCVFSYPELLPCEQTTASAPAAFPYIPGLHVFREGPAILKALNRLTKSPDIIIFAGHGLAHAGHFGLASHLGLLTDCPAIGCARKRLAGQHDPVGSEKGSSSDLFLHNKKVGLVYRSRENVKPIFISPGHYSTLDDAVRITVSCLRGYRMPEPLRAAHRLANRVKREK